MGRAPQAGPPLSRIVGAVASQSDFARDLAAMVPIVGTFMNVRLQVARSPFFT